MHYKNGRKAKSGDLILALSNQNIGVLHSINSSTTTCNGRLAPTTPNDPYVTLGECLHIDDIKASEIKNTEDEGTKICLE